MTSARQRDQPRMSGVRLILPVVLFFAAGCGVSPGTPPEGSGRAQLGTSAARAGETYPGPPEPVTPPCAGAPPLLAALGSPSGSQPAWFHTDGSPLYITARRFEHGGIFDPDVGQTAIYLGPAEVTPQLLPNGYVRGATHSLSVREKTYGMIQLAAGSYWLTSSQGGDVLVIACSPNALTQVTPAT